jgi:Arc/MetJ family transcription regulator
MPTNLAIEDRLVEEARRVGGHRSKRDAVNSALREYVRRHRQQDILRLAGTIDYDADYDPKALRRRRCA